MNQQTRLCVLGLVSLEEHRRIKDLITCYKYINDFTDVDVHYFTPGLCLTRSRSYKFSSATLTVLSSLFLIELCLHGIAFLILLFLLRVLSYLENVCLCITVQVIISQCYCACFFGMYSLLFFFFFFFSLLFFIYFRDEPTQVWYLLLISLSSFDE